jgi:SEC-C motif domain protein
MMCPCGSKQPFENCCAPYLAGSKLPPTAEALMRSRYVAFSKGNIDYLSTTLAPESRGGFESASVKQWAEAAQFKGLKILATQMGGQADSKGTVEFMATYTQAGETWDHHEVSKFRKDGDGRWFFVEGDSHRHRAGEDHHHQHHQKTVVRDGPKIGRNDPCPCGSGKKFKKCCGGLA